MKPSYLLAALAPAMVLADPVPLASLDRVVANLPSNSNPLAHRSPAASIPDMVPRNPLPVDPAESSTLAKRGARHVLQVSSEGSLGQTPWIGMAIGLTCTALAAVMLG